MSPITAGEVNGLIQAYPRGGRANSNPCFTIFGPTDTQHSSRFTGSRFERRKRWTHVPLFRTILKVSIGLVYKTAQRNLE